MIAIKLSRQTDADLNDILDYSIQQYGREAAEAYLRTIHAAIDRLRAYPDLGTPRQELRDGMRSIPAGEHRIFYRHDDIGLLIARVLHKRMDATQALS